MDSEFICTFYIFFNSALCTYFFVELFQNNFCLSIRQIPFYVVSYFLSKTSLAKIEQVSSYPRSGLDKFHRFKVMKCLEAKANAFF